MNHKKRKQYIINLSVQSKLITLILLSIIIPTMLTFTSLYFLFQSKLIETQASNEMLYNALLSISHSVYIILIIGFLFITIFLICWSSIFLHRVVGPLYRIEKEIGKAIEDKKITKIKFRKKDSLFSLAEKINLLIEKIQTRE